ncbi:MAG: DUF1579 domain-containing protein [Alphaproteobacteria bacterium]|nr:DUF1579 domain-containing protein [Alphaproteobacteria bacterium]MBU1513686.1 DUF1579 domain-containing protein [Alphaproteobacteria bacterium]MBU2094669.1 DUF1579 domain-containing protein [Alphaproteobacteria bacterium]MBU2150262.1 DUF1579 domain-containing protein [Alphaproteobacteria bacterium]MBU2309209.1 DUF1579 domain-containing protein [Alphaproteobacteria bacterium]
MAAPQSGLAQAGGSFDFLHGRWSVIHRKLRARLAGSRDWFEFPGTLEVEPILSGLGNVDRNVLHDPAGRYEATSLRLFDREAGRWSIYWLDARSPTTVDPPVVGGFSGRKGTFFSDDSFAGRPIRVRTTYEPLGADTAEWTQAFSADAGATWETNWVMSFHRAARS